MSNALTQVFPPATIRRQVSVPMSFADGFSTTACVFTFDGLVDGKEHIAMVHGDVMGQADVPTRMHSECLTGDVMGSLRCDCRDQLEVALRKLAAMPRGLC